MKYLIVLEGNGACAAYDSQAVAEGEARRLSMRAGAHFIAVPQHEDHAPMLLAALKQLVEPCECYGRDFGSHGKWCEQAREAIAAAEGK